MIRKLKKIVGQDCSERRKSKMITATEYYRADVDSMSLLEKIIFVADFRKKEEDFFKDIKPSEVEKENLKIKLGGE